jgi:hypothetical protein
MSVSYHVDTQKQYLISEEVSENTLPRKKEAGRRGIILLTKSRGYKASLQG